MDKKRSETRASWASEASPTLGCSIEISRDMYVGMSVVCQINCVGGVTWTKHAHAQSQVLGTRVIHFLYARALAWTKKKPKKSVHLEMRNLKLTELQRLKNRGKKG